MKKLILSALAISFISTGQAQISIAPVVGLNVSSYTATVYKYSWAYGSNIKSRPGICFGAFVDLPLKKNLILQTGLLYKANGYETTSNTAPESSYMNLRVSALDVPLKLTYSLFGSKGSQFFIGAGPYIAMNIGVFAHSRFMFYSSHGLSPLPIYSDEKQDIGHPSGISRMDLGGGLNIGYKAAIGLLICLQGQYGIANQGDVDSYARNYNFGIVGGYSFKMKKHKIASEKSKELVN